MSSHPNACFDLMKKLVKSRKQNMSVVSERSSHATICRTGLRSESVTTTPPVLDALPPSSDRSSSARFMADMTQHEIYLRLRGIRIWAMAGFV